MKTVWKINKKERKILKLPNFKHLEDLISKDAVKTIPVHRIKKMRPGVVLIKATSLMLLIAASRQLVGYK